MSRGVALSCGLICALWAWYTFQMFLRRWADPTAFDELRTQVPLKMWVPTLAFALGFAVMAIEFARFAFGRELMHGDNPAGGSDQIELEQAEAVEEGAR